MLPCFGNSVVGHPSRMLQPRDRVLILATCSRVKGPIAKGTQRFSRLPHGYTFQSWKTPRKFFHNFDFECFGGLPWRLVSVTKNACFAFQRLFFKIFLVFPSTFCDYSLSSPFLSQLKLIQTLHVTLYKLHFCTFSPSNLQEKGMGSYFLASYLVFWASFSWIFVLVFCFFRYGFVSFFFFLDCPCLDCWSIVPVRTCFGR